MASALPDPGLAAFFVVGLFGGAHCLGMCGPLVTLYAERIDDGAALGWRDVRQHALFNAGRTASYTVIGGLAGAAGALLFDAGAVVGAGDVVRGLAGVGVGLAVLAAGLGYLRGGSNAFGALELPGADRVSGALAARAEAWTQGPRIVGLGAIHGLLPCPILYPAFLAAFAAGTPVGGALSLLALGVGTFPTLFLYGTAVGAVSADTRTRLHRALGVAFLGLAYPRLGVPLPMVPVPFYQPL
jgi:sulfite exporter TauE/SafE